MRSLQEIVDYCNKTNKTTLRRTLPRMVESFNSNSPDVKLHYAYHEDGAETWKFGWSESDYYPEDYDEETEDIIKLFEFTWLTGKKRRASRAFTKAPTYTAECAIFLFKIQPADASYRAAKLTPGWRKDFEKAKEWDEEKKKARVVWNSKTKQEQNEIIALEKELDEIIGTPFSKDRRDKIENILREKGRSPKPHSQKWIEEAASCKTADEYVALRSKELKKELTQVLAEK